MYGSEEMKEKTGNIILALILGIIFGGVFSYMIFNDSREVRDLEREIRDYKYNLDKYKERVEFLDECLKELGTYICGEGFEAEHYQKEGLLGKPLGISGGKLICTKQENTTKTISIGADKQ